MKAIVFDKHKNRLEMDVEGIEGEPIEMQKEFDGKTYKVMFDFAFYDRKMRPVYMEKERKLITKENGD